MTCQTTISRRGLLLTGAGAAASTLLPGKPAQAKPKPLTVVELFTSQGCSSCPPADAYLGRLVERDDVIALSLNVDYWDYIGWRDTLASPEFSRRQREYAQRRGDNRVYTPQMVINGGPHAVGSRSSQVEPLIKAAQDKAETSRVDLNLSEEGGEVVVEVTTPSGQNAKADATVWIAMVQPKVVVPITRGENTGRTITYYNVVRKLMPAGMWHGEAMRLALPKSDLFTDGAKACCAIVQEGSVGPIIGAASFGQIHG